MSETVGLTIATWLLAAATLLGAGGVIWQLVREVTARNEQNHIMRQREALRMYTQTFDIRSVSGRDLPNDRDSEAVTAMVEQVKASRAGLDRDQLSKVVETQAAIRNYLNHWEAIAVAVAHSVVDESVMHDLAWGRLCAIWANYRPFVEWRREVTGSNTLWIEVERLATRWATPPN